MKNLCIDLYCGLGGWADGFLAEGYEVIGFDIERHCYPARQALPESHAKSGGGIDFNRGDSFNSTNEKRLRDAPLTGGWDQYPGQLVLQDVLTIHGSQFRDAVVIVASPPCQAYSYRAMPWKRAKALPPPSNELFDACFRIQREACDAAGRYIPLVVENVKGAQPWVGRAAWHYGSYYLWGDVPALMPWTGRAQKANPDGTNHGQGSWFAIADSKERGSQKNRGGSWFGIGSPGQTELSKNPVHELTRNQRESDAVKQHCSGEAIKVSGDWFGAYAEQKAAGTISPGRLHGKNSTARKAASAQIAKIPFALAQHIAHVYRNHPLLNSPQPSQRLEGF